MAPPSTAETARMVLLCLRKNTSAALRVNPAMRAISRSSGDAGGGMTGRMPGGAGAGGPPSLAGGQARIQRAR